MINTNKKMLNILILKILEDYTDSEHKLTQQQIKGYLKSSYDIICDRRAVKSNIENLIDCDYDIEYDNGYYLASRTFEDAELRMLIDSVLCSRTLSEKESRLLIEKLKGLGNTYFEAKVSHVCCNMNMPHLNSKQLVYTVDVIHDAIDQKKKIAFTYNQYETDFKLHPKRNQRYIVNPFQMVVNLGKYYLIGNYDKYDDISHYRLDLMTDVEIMNEKRKSKSIIKGMENGLSLPNHMVEHVYMYSGESIYIKLKAKKEIMTELIDWLGKDFKILTEDETYITIRLKCNDDAMFYWALQYGSGVEVLEPIDLRKRIYKMICEMKDKYTKGLEEM